MIENCPMRHENGNCIPAGGFCTANKNICEALLNAYRMGKAQLSSEGTTSDLISKFIDGLEETFANIREREGGDSVCGLCEYDGAYIGESGNWCNECPGFEKDDCFKLSDETRKKWTDEIIKALPTIQPEPSACEYCHEDSDGYVTPIEKNGHAFIRFGMDGWELSLHAKGWHGSAKIKYCPICGRRLTHE